MIVSPKPAVDPTAAASVSADDHLYLVHPDAITEIATDAKAAWDDLLAGSAGKTTPELQALVTTVFQRYGILPSHIRERLTCNPISA